MEREHFSPGICILPWLKLEESGSKHGNTLTLQNDVGFLIFMSEDLFVLDGEKYRNGGKMRKNPTRSPSSTRHSVTVLLILSNLKIQATKVEAYPCLSWTPATNQSWTDVHVHDFKRFPLAKIKLFIALLRLCSINMIYHHPSYIVSNSDLYLNIFTSVMRHGSLGPRLWRRPWARAVLVAETCKKWHFPLSLHESQ